MEKALEVMKEMKEFGACPNIYHNNTVLHAQCMERRVIE